MKKIYSLVVLALCSLLVACNGIGSKDTLVARIGNEPLYAEDLDFLVVQNYGQPGSEKYQSAAENLLFSLAKVSKVTGESASYDSAWKVYETVLRDRLLSIVYTRFHLMSRLGYTDEELKKFFNEHRSEFDSAATYIAVREEVAGRYYLSQNQDSLKRFIQQALPEKDVPANVELLFFMGDSLAVSEIAGKLNGNVPEDSMQNVRHIMVAQGKEQGVFADSSVMGALFFADSMKVGESRSFRVMQDSSLAHFVLKVQKRTPAVKAREEDYVKEFEQAFIGQQKQAMSQKVQEMVSDLGSVVVEKMVPKDPHKFYEDNKDKFMTAPGYEVYHVAMKDSVALAKTMENVKDLESFKAVAATISENEETSENNGFVGRVKKNYALPYGIGMMPALWPELEGKAVGYISSAIRSMSDSLYHSFYVSAVIPSEPKAFDRVEKQLEELYASDVNAIDPATVLVSDNGKPVYTKADLLKIFDAEPGIPYNKETHYNILNMLAQAYAIGEKARQEKIDQSWEFRALTRVARIDFINNRYDRDQKTTEPAEPQFADKLKKYEYYSREAAYKGKSFEEVESQIVNSLEVKAKVNVKLVTNMEIWNKTNVFFYDRSKANLVPVTTAEGFLAIGDSAAKVQKFNEAISAYKKVIDLFASRDTLFRTAVYNLAQVYSDAQKYEESAANFEALLKVWPDAPEAEKAMFSLGFVLNENLKRDDRALEVLEDFQKRFPKSELKESVDWLVENIKSNGKLAEDLMKKIESEE